MGCFSNIVKKIAFSVCFAAGWGASACAAECPGHPDAIGTSRVVVVDPAEHSLVGSMQYDESLPLADHEVVLSFDDGPSSVNTPRVLDILASECIKATFFIVGRMAADSPALVKREFDEGHTVATHTQNHPLNMHRMPPKLMQKEIDDGVSAAAVALGDGKAPAPFFRIPGLDRSRAIEAYAKSRGLMVWSADFDADDWTPIPPAEIVRRTMKPLKKRGRGVIEWHDIHSRTVEALPLLIAELKKGDYHIVHIRPVGAGETKTATTAREWLFDDQ